MLNRSLRVVAFLGVAAAYLPSVGAEPRALDFDDAVRLVREQAPDLRARRAEVAVADARIVGARTWRANPSLSVSSGPRISDETTVDVMVGLQQPIIPGGRSAARVEVEEARRRVAGLEVDDEARQLVAAAARAFARLLYWQHRATLAQRNLALAIEVHAVATRRNEVGDVGGLDPSVALVARSRADADVARIEAARLRAEAELRWLLGLDDDTTIVATGDLQTVARRDIVTAESRSDVRLARAAADVERARQHLATRDRVPGFAVGLVGGREEGATVLKGVFEITLPVFSRGQPALLEAEAAEAAHTEHATVVESRVAHEVRTARRRAAVLDEAVANFASGGLAAVAKTAEIATGSYRAGAIPLPELLVVQRELMATEHDFAELLLSAALARIEVLDSTESLSRAQPTDQENP